MMKESVRVYAERKEEVESLKAVLKTRREEFDLLNKDLTDRLRMKTEELNEVMVDVRNAALFEFDETGQKKLFGGIGIREKKSIKYDQAEAFSWAKEKDMFLTLDKKAFEKAADGLSLPFVSVKKEPQVTFPKEVTLDE